MCGHVGRKRAFDGIPCVRAGLYCGRSVDNMPRGVSDRGAVGLVEHLGAFVEVVPKGGLRRATPVPLYQGGIADMGLMGHAFDPETLTHAPCYLAGEVHPRHLGIDGAVRGCTAPVKVDAVPFHASYNRVLA